MTKFEMRKRIEELEKKLKNTEDKLKNTGKTCDYFCEELKKKTERAGELQNAYEENERLKSLCEAQQKTIDRLNRQITEKELYEKKLKSLDPTGVPAIDLVFERMCRLEAKIEAQENPYFF